MFWLLPPVTGCGFMLATRMTAPNVTIVIPTYNRARLLPRAVSSVQAQTCAEWELIVVDDGSTDSTVADVTAMAAADPRIRLAVNTRRRGPAGARNAGIAVARAPWVAFLDSDDNWEPQKLARFMTEAKAHPEALLIGSDYWMVDRDRNRNETMLAFVHREMIRWWESDPAAAAVVPWRAIKNDSQALAVPEIMRATALGEFLWVHTSSAMIRLDATKALGGFDESLIVTEDIDLWLKLADRGPVRFIAEPLATFRIDGRDIGAGERYVSQARQRRPNLYASKLAHLDLHFRMARRYGRTAEQLPFFLSRLNHYHRICAEAALHNGFYWTYLAHRLACSRFGALGRLLAWLPPLRGRIPGPEIQAAGQSRR
jgi:glycosyltransferase involved in cell wall biosynthesis